MAVWDDGEDTFFSCPMQYLTDNIQIWTEEMAYSQEFSGTSYNDQTNVWIEAWMYYRSVLNKFTEMANKNRDRSSQGLDALKAGYFSRSKHG